MNPVRPLLWLLAALAWGPLLPAAAVQQPTTAELLEASTWPELLARDARLASTSRTTASALVELQRPGLTDEQRSVALFALGFARTRSERSRLESWAIEGSPELRSAAILGLGELGTPDPGLVVRIVEDASLEIAEHGLIALLRGGTPAGLDYVRRIASDSGHPLAVPASEALVFHLDPGNSRPRPALRRLLELRFAAARRYGLVAGQSWRVLLMSELLGDSEFLDEVVYRAAGELKRPGVRDHFLEVLLAGSASLENGGVGGTQGLRGAVNAMPDEVSRLIASGLWSPRDERAWTALLTEIDLRRLEGLTDTILRRAFVIPGLRAYAALLLVRGGVQEGLPLLELNLQSEDPVERARIAEGLGGTGIGTYVPMLEALRKDKVSGVRSAALVAQARLGEVRALNQVRQRVELEPVERTRYEFDEDGNIVETTLGVKRVVVPAAKPAQPAAKAGPPAKTAAAKPAPKKTPAKADPKKAPAKTAGAKPKAGRAGAATPKKAGGRAAGAKKAGGGRKKKDPPAGGGARGGGGDDDQASLRPPAGWSQALASLTGESVTIGLTLGVAPRAASYAQEGQEKPAQEPEPKKTPRKKTPRKKAAGAGDEPAQAGQERPARKNAGGQQAGNRPKQAGGARKAGTRKAGVAKEAAATKEQAAGAKPARPGATPAQTGANPARSGARAAAQEGGRPKRNAGATRTRSEESGQDTARSQRDRASVIEMMCRTARDPLVRGVLVELLPKLEGVERVRVGTALALLGDRDGLEIVRENLRAEPPRGEAGAQRIAALGRKPSLADLELLRGLFPVEHEREVNVELVLALIRARDSSALPVLQSALWSEPFNRSVLAGALMIDVSGIDLLREELESPPVKAGVRDVRRVGFVLGEWGGLEEVERLGERVSSGDAGLQGALLGALGARTF